MKTISLTVPMDPSILSQTATYFQLLADSLSVGDAESETRAQVEADMTPIPNMSPQTPAPAPVAETPAPAPVAEAPSPAPVAEAPAPVHGVTLDSDGLPWDSRIHAGTKTYVKKTGQWKKKRGIDPVIVQQVGTELKTTMAAPAPAPVAPAPAPAAVVIDPATITNFAEFMSACTSTGVTPESIMSACQQHGVQAPTLLAARPDLVPAVALALFTPAV